jgi:hypothetical protein
MGPLPKSSAGFNPPCSRFDAACQAPLSSYIKAYYDSFSQPRCLTSCGRSAMPSLARSGIGSEGRAAAA